MQNRKYDWASRDQWARNVRLAYIDRFTPLDIRFRLEDAEKAAIRRELTEMRLELSRQIKQLRDSGAMEYHKGEGMRDHLNRIDRLPPGERQRHDDLLNAKYRIREVNRMLRDEAELWDALEFARDWFPPTLAAACERYRVAYDDACERYTAECEARPIDDEAWQKELEWRAKIEAGPFTHGG
jgi:hypothetical protein